MVKRKSSTKTFLQNLSGFVGILSLLSPFLVNGAKRLAYEYYRPQMEFRVIEDHERQPIKIGWDKQLLTFSLENRSRLPIKISDLAVGFTPNESFQLLPNATYFAQLEESKTSRVPFEINLKNPPSLRRGEDLQSAVQYFATRSKKPFSLVFRATAVSETDSLGFLSNWFAPPTQTIERTFSFVPEGRDTDPKLCGRAGGGVSVKRFGMINMVPSNFYTTDPHPSDGLACYGVGPQNQILIQKIQPKYIPYSCNELPPNGTPVNRDALLLRMEDSHSFIGQDYPLLPVAGLETGQNIRPDSAKNGKMPVPLTTATSLRKPVRRQILR